MQACFYKEEISCSITVAGLGEECHVLGPGLVATQR